MPLGKHLGGERRVSEPADIRRVAGTIEASAADKTEIKQQAAEGGQPETQRVEAREGHVASADHQRNQVGAEPEHERHGHKENHGGAMHREHAIENFGRNEVIVRDHQLNSHDGGLDAADDQHHQGVDDVHNAQALVIDGGDPAVQPFADGPVAGGDFVERDCFRSHVDYSLSLT